MRSIVPSPLLFSSNGGSSLGQTRHLDKVKLQRDVRLPFWESDNGLKRLASTDEQILQPIAQTLESCDNPGSFETLFNSLR